MQGGQRTLTRCSVSSISLSGLSINSDDSHATLSSAASQVTTPRGTLRRGLGSEACTNLRALAVQYEESSTNTGMQVDTTGDDWGYFVEGATRNTSFGSVQISW